MKIDNHYATPVWQPGDHVVYRGVVHGRVCLACPVTVVADTPERTILLFMPGTRCKFPSNIVHGKYAQQADVPSRWAAQASGNWETVDVTWREHRLLIFLEPSAWFSTRLWWHHATNEFQRWYVNFELPFTRTAIGFDSLDLELDLVIQPDGTQQWKDEAEYQEGIRLGEISAEAVQQIGAARPIVLERIARKIEPFDMRWLAWKPPHDWPIPQLHPMWCQTAI